MFKYDILAPLPYIYSISTFPLLVRHSDSERKSGGMKQEEEFVRFLPLGTLAQTNGPAPFTERCGAGDTATPVGIVS